MKRHLLEGLYTGNGALDIIGKRKRGYIIFSVLFLACIASIVFRGFNLGIDFEGGTRVQFPATSAAGPIDTQRAEDIFTEALGKEPASVQTVGAGDTATIQIRSEALTPDQVSKLKGALFEQLKPVAPNGTSSEALISDSAVSGSWGGEISSKALWALLVFLALVSVFLALYFEKWMAVAALVGLFHDLIVTAGVYSMVGFEVTPATVIGLLTILGFSLYDTVVVFDKVKENTRGLLGLTRRTYGEAANLAVNQTLMRSINTSLIALLPVTGLLVIGVGLLGVGTLADLALVQATGMLAGVVSSIFLCTPVLVDLKMMDPKYKLQAQRVAQRRANIERRHSAAAADDVDLSDDDAIDAEVRKERAMVVAGGVPARNPKAVDQRRKPGGKPQGKKRK
ncbi:protein translocase subunit SecF [Actinokineospora fastidiosa]|uniref:Protein-export membrane protein SecF n=1 Tax=Actinokineospora fastidiosa TaxID=1816 RepID=A0A918GNC4_9PSEU|nr:protein translocase subunit SecF [Actinokineospora fastidiosa]GGS48591.1 protein-export membrane protein SecF [Actinokineospora fastidiosa]